MVSHQRCSLVLSPYHTSLYKYIYFLFTNFLPSLFLSSSLILSLSFFLSISLCLSSSLSTTPSPLSSSLPPSYSLSLSLFLCPSPYSLALYSSLPPHTLSLSLPHTLSLTHSLSLTLSLCTRFYWYCVTTSLYFTHQLPSFTYLAAKCNRHLVCTCIIYKCIKYM